MLKKKKRLHLPSRRKLQTLKKGLPPGSIMFLPAEQAGKTMARGFRYSAKELIEFEINLASFSKPEEGCVWLNWSGFQDAELLQRIGDVFQIDNLVLEDIANANQQPKTENHGNYIFIEVTDISYNVQEKSFHTEQLSMVFFREMLLSFSQHSTSAQEILTERIRGNGKVRERGTDYLAYSLVDVIVDNYFVVLEAMAVRLEELEETLWTNAGRDLLDSLYEAKRSTAFLRKTIRPVREMIQNLNRIDSPLIDRKTRPYLSDLLDHIQAVQAELEHQSDLATELLGLYLSRMSHSMNETMKILTVMGTIFIPLTFLSSLYGMNFQNMPELKWKYGYYILLGIMSAVSIGLGIFFRLRRWF